MCHSPIPENFEAIIRFSRLQLYAIPEIKNFNVIVPNFIKIGRSAEEIWRFNCFSNGDHAPCWIIESQIFQRSGPLRQPF